jgi:endonuclease/exonuclease/phosphatase family metal-dependent hydrolase
MGAECERGSIRKYQLGPLRRALSRYRGTPADRAAVIAGDLNSNTIWDRPGWRINHSTKVKILEKDFGLVSAYHAVRGEPHGRREADALLRDRTKDGPTYHIDYVFVPSPWIGKARVHVGAFEIWCGSGLSDHVPVIVDVDI